MMKCYICGSKQNQAIGFGCRDAPQINVLKCDSCTLEFLSDFSHISSAHYEKSGMHNFNPPNIDFRLAAGLKDDSRRVRDLSEILNNRSVLDFGCGSGGFLSLVKKITKNAIGIELDESVRKYYEGKIDIYRDLNYLEDGRLFDVITMFHALEHLPDPRRVLMDLYNVLDDKGMLIVEVPNASDALISLYDSQSFKKFTHWSQHLYYFNENTLRLLIESAGFSKVNIKQLQRYPLSNHLYWLKEGLPGGHLEWSFLNSQTLDEAYQGELAKNGRCDTLIAYIKK
jgi:2-polyprenyl-3-methyl-5-hydroxy-6-metoxy-1,4-benzoquinol methylase